jgi:hypothetical protein
MYTNPNIELVYKYLKNTLICTNKRNDFISIETLFNEIRDRIDKDTFLYCINALYTPDIDGEFLHNHKIKQNVKTTN